MTHTVDVTAVASRLDHLLQAVGGGDEILIVKEDKPIARIVPVASPPDRVPGSAKGLIQMSDDFDAPLEDFREYME